MTEVPQGETAPSIVEQLRPLFFPRSVAVVGVSKDPWKPGAVMLRTLKRFGFPGVVYVVSSRGGELQGMPVYQTVSALPEAVDLAFLYMPARAIPAAVRECRDKGVRSVVVFAAGFGETGTPEGRALEAQLAAECDGSFRMLGPNCLGLYSPAGGITQHCGTDYAHEAGDVAFIAQSGVLSQDFACAMPSHGFRASRVVSYGNAVDLNEADLLEYLGADPETRIVGIYMEGPRDGRAFCQVLRRVAPTKPVIVWKGGLTPKGSKAAASHTGSLAGSLEVWKAMLDQAGAVRVASLEEMLDAITAFHFLEGYDDPRVGYVCSGGGYSVGAADASYAAGLLLPAMSPATEAAIAAALSPVGTSAKNPIDVFTPFAPSEELKGSLEALAGSGEVGCIVIDHIALSTESRRLLRFTEYLEKEDEPWLPELPVRIQRDYGLPVVVVLREEWDPRQSLAFEAERSRLRRYYEENGVAVFSTSDRAFRALGQVVAHYRWRAAALEEPGHPRGDVSARNKAVALIRAALEQGRTSLSEHESKHVLRVYGIPVTKERVVASPDELAAALPEFDYPVVLKIDSPDILHKTEAGLVELGCRNAQDAGVAFERIMAEARRQFPEAKINGVLVQEMVTPVAECIVGMKVDPQLGPAVMFGLGGIFVEAFGDVALRVAPLTRAQAADMVRETKGYKLLAGARGRAKGDVPAIEDVLVKMSTLALDLEDHVSEIDVNPLMVLPEGRGAVAADALVIATRRAPVSHEQPRERGSA